MPTIELDYSNDADTYHVGTHTPEQARPIVEASVRGWLDEQGFADVTFAVKQVFGPGGGAAVIDFTVGDELTMRRFVTMYDAGNGDVDFLLEGVRA